MTFSIVALDPISKAFGVATATGGPAVGSLVPYARAGVGAVATQGYTTNPFYGFSGLDMFARDMAAPDVLATLTEADKGRERRQCVMIDKTGATAAWNGAELSPYNGAILEQGIGVAGNLLVGAQVLEAMRDAYNAATDEPFAQRLLSAMAAGQAAGGDRRGTRSAALKVYTSEPYPAVDVRVDWSDTPIADLGTVMIETHTPPYADFFEAIPTIANPSSS